jgi:acyl-CoA dehydrogenase
MAIDFEVTPELAELQARIRRFIADEIIPLESDARRTRHGPSEELRRELIDKAREAGLLAPHVAKQYGGLALTHVGRAIAFEEAGYSPLGPVALNVFAPDEGNMHLLEAVATPAQKERWLRPLAAGTIRSCFCMTEPAPGAGSDPSMLTATATRDGDDYVINGAKRYITNAPEAGVFTLMARTDPHSKDASGVSAFIVERNTPGLTVGKPDRKMGQRGSHTADVIFDNARVPAENIIGGKEGVGFKTAMKVLDKARLNIAAVCVGAATRMLEEALTYALERKQFGQPIAEFQLVQAMLADCQTEIFAARSMTLEAARTRDAGGNVTLEASCCKYFASEMCGRVADRAVQVHGGAGYMADSPIERFYRDVRLFRLYEGTSQIQQLIIARNMIRNAGR